MSKIILTCATAVALLTSSVVAFAGDVYVRGYTRSNGTYVAPHYRSSPNNSYNDNWSVRGNSNPYTGSSGTLSPTWDNRQPSGLNSLGGSGNSFNRRW